MDSKDSKLTSPRLKELRQRMTVIIGIYAVAVMVYLIIVIATNLGVIPGYAMVHGDIAFFTFTAIAVLFYYPVIGVPLVVLTLVQMYNEEKKLRGSAKVASPDADNGATGENVSSNPAPTPAPVPAPAIASRPAVVNPKRRGWIIFIMVVITALLMLLVPIFLDVNFAQPIMRSASPKSQIYSVAETIDDCVLLISIVIGVVCVLVCNLILKRYDRRHPR